MRFWVFLLLATNIIQAGYYAYTNMQDENYSQIRTKIVTAPTQTVIPAIKAEIEPEKSVNGSPLCQLEIRNIRQKYQDYFATVMIDGKPQILKEGQGITPFITVKSISSYGIYLHYRDFEQFIPYSPLKNQQVVDKESEDEAVASIAFPEAEPVKQFDSSRIDSKYRNDIRLVAANVFEVRRSLFGDFIKSRKEIKSIAFAVSSKGGFQATQVEKEGLFASLGLETGDIIKSINHQDLNSISDVVEVYQQASKYESIELNLERQGQKIYYYYNMYD